MMPTDRLLAPAPTGRLHRRQFVRRLLGIMLALPVLGGLAQACAPTAPSASPTAAPVGKPTAAAKPAAASPAAVSPAAGGAAAGLAAMSGGFQPAQRGGGGLLKMLFWQAPNLLSSHHGGTTNRPISRAFLEPLAEYDPNGELIPVLAREIPSYASNTLDREGTWVIWRLMPGVLWHDGQPVTSDDVIFTWEYLADPTSAATSRGSYAGIEKVEKVDDTSVRVTFKNPTSFWHQPFVHQTGTLLPKHIMEAYRGDKAQNAPFHTKPVGTGPYKVVDFKPGDLVIGEINTAYHMPNRPYFDRIEIKGGGDAASALRAVMQTGEYDFAPSLQVDKDTLTALEGQGPSRLIYASGISTEMLELNFADPNIEVDGERSSPRSKHPFLTDLKVRQALALSVNRPAIIDALLGPTGSLPRYLYFSPTRYVPDGGDWEYNPTRAAQLLDEAGWARGAGGVRAKDGVRMKVLYQTTVNGLRQQVQAIMKKEFETLGLEVELKAIPSDVFFSTDPNNPDSNSKFLADIQEWSTSPSQPDPQFFMQGFITSQIAQASNKWSGQNRARYSNPEIDRLWEQAGKELDQAKRDEIFKSMNRTLHSDVNVVPLFVRNNAFAAKRDLFVPPLHTWSGELPNLAYWHQTR
jgi:peptide/nickel transport system substrate-binding protein